MLLFSTILDIESSFTPEAFIQLVLKWNATSQYAENIIENIRWNGQFNNRYGNDDLWLAIEEYPAENIVAVRYEKKQADNTIWDTDYVMNFNTMKMGIRLDRSYTEEALGQDPAFSTPHFITLLIENGYLKSDKDLPVGRVPIEITQDNVESVASIMNREVDYRLPVIYISRTYENELPVDVNRLAGRVKGVAHVLVQTDISTNGRLRGLCHDNNEYYGAIGIYYPEKGDAHRKYLYRMGYEKSLMEKVIYSVIHYSNIQRMEPLYTWQGVNNAILKDKFNDQWQASLKAQKEAEDILYGFDEDMERLQQQIESLTRANESLQAENYGLRSKLEAADSLPILYMGNEEEFYPGEIKDIVLSVLDKAVSAAEPKTRKYDILQDLLDNNEYLRINEQNAKELKRLLKDYNGVNNRLKKDLENIGFVLEEDGKHLKVLYYGDPRYHVVLSKTPSDGRAGMNNALMLIKIAL